VADLRIVVNDQTTCVAGGSCGGWHRRKVTRGGVPQQPSRTWLAAPDHGPLRF
jgi:hypothetical protein